MKGIVKIAIAVVVQAALAWAITVFLVGPTMRGEPLPWQKAKDEEAAAETEGPRELGPLLPLEEILVNVADTGGRRYFKTSLTLEMEGKDLEKTAPNRLPLLRGRVIDLLAHKTLDELTAPEARESLRSEILDTLNSEVSGGEFRDLFFTEFLVQ
ncbi:MAG: flagellar basal body-associated FliL family protein [bacterium]